MESKRSSMRGGKRRRSSCRPRHEMSTRSKYQMHIHRNRSGRSRSATSFSHKNKGAVLPYFQSLNKKLKRGPNQQPTNGDDQVLHVLIKDLRTKRIFTPKLTDVDSRIGESGGEFDLIHQKENSFPWSRNEICENEEKEKNDGGIENLDEINSIVSPTVSECPNGGNEVRENSEYSEQPLDLNISVSKLSVENEIRASSCSELVDEANEECLQATPPDAEIVQEFNRNKRNDMPSDGIDQKCIVHAGELPASNISIRTESISKTRFVLRPCFKRRLFKAPGSFSYKKLLLFLKDIAGDDAGVPEGCQGTKVENGLMNKPLEPTVLADFSKLLNDRKQQDSESPECDIRLPIALDNPCLINEQCLEFLVDGRTDNFVGDSKLCRTKKSGDDLLEVKREKDDSKEESIVITPPDAELLDKQVVEESGSHKIECNQMDTDQDLGQPLNSTENHDCHSISIDKGNNSSYNRKGVQDTCARLKIFRSPGSVSYKRLLPFLMDLVKENSSNTCVSGNNDNSKFGKDSLSMAHSEGANSEAKEIPLDISNSCTLYTNQHSNDPASLSMTVWNTMNGSGSEKESNLTSFAKTPDSIISSESENKQLQSEQAVESDRCQVETSPNITLSIHGGVPTSSHESFLGEFVRLDSCQSCSDTEKVCTKCSNNAELHKPNILKLNSSYGEQPFVPSEIPVSFKKNKFKKNPRGCRGLCTCLNCSSFRLHAERAFEFSRNQLLDAEEVASDLITELSYLRSVLEKSADAAHLNQVKEACKKSSEAEAVAEDRFSQMNDELKIHSRILCSERPNVKFANNVEVKIIHLAK